MLRSRNHHSFEQTPRYWNIASEIYHFLSRPRI